MEGYCIWFPKWVEESDIHKFQIVVQVNFMHCSFGQDLENSKHEIAQSGTGAKGKHVPSPEDFINRKVLGVDIYIATRKLLRTVKKVPTRMIHFISLSPFLC